MDLRFLTTSTPSSIVRPVIPWIAGRDLELSWGCYNLSTSRDFLPFERYIYWRMIHCHLTINTLIPYGIVRYAEKGSNVVPYHNCIQLLYHTMFGSKRRDLILWYRGFSSFFFLIQIRWRTSNIYAPEKMDTKKSSYLNGPFFSKTHVVKLPGCNVPDVRSVRRNSHSRRMREYPGLRTPEDGAWWMMATCNLWSWFSGMKCHAYGYQLSHCGYCYGIIGIINHDNIFWWFMGQGNTL